MRLIYIQLEESITEYIGSSIVFTKEWGMLGKKKFEATVQSFLSMCLCGVCSLISFNHTPIKDRYPIKKVTYMTSTYFTTLSLTHGESWNKLWLRLTYVSSSYWPRQGASKAKELSTVKLCGHTSNFKRAQNFKFHVESQPCVISSCGSLLIYKQLCEVRNGKRKPIILNVEAFYHFKLLFSGLFVGPTALNFLVSWFSRG